MFTKPSMMTRIAVGKTTAFLLVLLTYLFFSQMFEALTWQFQFGLALWYILLGASIGAFGMMGPVPVIDTKISWWIRGPWIGVCFNAILSLFIWQDLSAYQSATFGTGTLLASPVFFIVEGAFVGLVLDFLCTRFGGEAE